MALKAIRDTFALEPISADTEVRRFVKAGSILLPHYRPMEEDDVEETPAPNNLIIGNPVTPRAEGEPATSRKAAARK